MFRFRGRSTLPFRSLQLSLSLSIKLVELLHVEIVRFLLNRLFCTRYTVARPLLVDRVFGWIIGLEDSPGSRTASGLWRGL